MRAAELKEEKARIPEEDLPLESDAQVGPCISPMILHCVCLKFLHFYVMCFAFSEICQYDVPNLLSGSRSVFLVLESHTAGLGWVCTHQQVVPL